MDDILTKLNLETLAAVFRREVSVPLIVQSMNNEKIELLGVTAIGDEFDCVNFVKKSRRTTAAHHLVLEVLEAPQQAESAMYLKLTLHWRKECVFSILGVLGHSLKV